MMPNEATTAKKEAWYKKAWKFVVQMDSESPGVAARVGGSALVLLGCVFGLSFGGGGVGWRLVLGYVFLSAGLVCFVESNVRGIWPDKLPPGPLWGWVRSFLEVLLLISLAIYIGINGHRIAPPEDGSKLSVCQNDLAKTRMELQKCVPANGSANGNEVLGHPPPLPPPPPPLSATFWGFSLSWWWVLVAIVALIVVGLVAKKHKEVVPVAGAAGLATAALKDASELAKMNEHMYWYLLGTFLAVSGVLILLFFAAAIIDLFKRATPVQAPPADAHAAGESLWSKWVARWFGKPEDKPESKENYLSSLGFSVVVLLWAAVMVGYKVPGHENGTKSGSTGVADKSLESRALKPLRPFMDGLPELKDPEELNRWEGYLASQEMHRGDILLLLGSADCKAFRKGGDGRDNPTLAKDRAKKVRDWLKPMMDARGVELDPDSVEQHERCRESADLRAVYPFLIQATGP